MLFIDLMVRRSRALCGVVLAVLLLGATSARAIPLLNGGFESGDFSPGWSRLPDSYNGQYTLVFGNNPWIVPYEGHYFASFSNYAPAVSGISQTVATTPGETYMLRSWFTNIPESDQLNEFKITWDNGVLLDMVDFAPIPQWTEFSFAVVGTGNDTVTFSGYQNFGRNGLDGVTLATAAPVPEPASVVLLAFGTAGLFVVRRRHGWRRLAGATVRPV